MPQGTIRPEEFLIAQIRKPTKRSTRHLPQKAKPTTMGTRQVVERIDAMMRVLVTIRRQLADLPKVFPGSGLTQNYLELQDKGRAWDMAGTWI
jgi:hypothetical protein